MNGKVRSGYYVLMLQAALLGASGCVSPHAEPAAPVTTTVMVPSITTQVGTQETQSKGGLTISIAPATYTVQQIKTESLTPVRSMLGSNEGRIVFTTRKTQTVPTVMPQVLKFTVKINNQMSHVFHGNGTIVQFNVGGKLLPVDQASYAPMTNAIVPPQGELQIDIFGPTLDQLPPGPSSLGLFFYDVVTGQNDAGVVTEKQNYTWDFAYNVTPQTVEVPAATSERVHMTREEYDAEMTKTQSPR